MVEITTPRPLRLDHLFFFFLIKNKSKPNTPFGSLYSVWKSILEGWNLELASVRLNSARLDVFGTRHWKLEAIPIPVGIRHRTCRLPTPSESDGIVVPTPACLAKLRPPVFLRSAAPICPLPSAGEPYRPHASARWSGRASSTSTAHLGGVQSAGHRTEVELASGLSRKRTQFQYH